VGPPRQSLAGQQQWQRASTRVRTAGPLAGPSWAGSGEIQKRILFFFFLFELKLYYFGIL
jgi:hypothetical protein